MIMAELDIQINEIAAPGRFRNTTERNYGRQNHQVGGFFQPGKRS